MQLYRYIQPFLAVVLLLAGTGHMVAAELVRPVVAGFERFHRDGKGEPLSAGQLLLGELNCVSCHATDAKLRTKQAPILDGIGSRVRVNYLKSYLSDPTALKPGTTMPHVLAEDPDKAKKVEALVHFLASTGSVRHERPDIKAAVIGRATYAKVGCIACHGPRDAAGDAEKNLPAYVVPMGDVKSKYTIPSLTAFLDNPLATRPSGRMPHVVPTKEARDIAHYLLQGIKGNFPELTAGTTKYSVYEGTWDNLPDFSKLKPKASGSGPAFVVELAQRGNNYGMRFEGYFKAEQEGQYRFHLNSDDGSRLLIDDKRVVDNDGIHAPKSASGNVKLTKGTHRVVVEFFQGGGGAELSVDFEGPGLARQKLAGFVAATAADLDKKTEPKKLVDEDTLEIQPQLVTEGKALFASLGCASCHQLKTDGKAITSTLKAPALSSLKATGGCLSEKPLKGIPFYGVDAAQRTALTAALAKPAPESQEPKAVIAHTMTTFNCYACHQRDKIGGPTEELNKHFTTTQPEMGDEARIPPWLDLVGAKLQPDYFKLILDKGAHDRPYMNTRMPGFGLANVSHLLDAYRAVDKLPSVPEVSFTANAATVRNAGWQMLGEQAYACIKCHTYAGQKAEGIQGIDMTLMPTRLQRDWFHAYLLKPQVIRPGTRMPSAWEGGVPSLPKILDGKTDQQIEAIWMYLKLGKSARLPLGVGRKTIILEPKTEAIIYRNFIEGAGTRAIAVGYPEKAHLAFDANDLRLVMIWQGEFIDAARHWTDRGVGFEGPLGDNVLKLHSGVPFAVMPKGDAAWPTASAKQLQYVFQGYRVTPDERPTFLYRMGDVKIADFPNAVATKTGSPRLVRTFELSSEKPVADLAYRAAIGTKIEDAGDGWYRVDNWKVKLAGGGKPIIRNVGGKAELIVPVTFADGKAKIVQEYQW